MKKIASIVVKGNTSITAQIGSDTMIANRETIKLDSSAIIDNGRTLVPLRAVSESLDCSVKWNCSRNWKW